jgi:hypothetical protein
MFYMYFFGWPYVSSKIWPPMIGPMEKPDPFTAFTLLYMVLKGMAYCVMGFISLLLYIYFK